MLQQHLLVQLMLQKFEQQGSQFEATVGAEVSTEVVGRIFEKQLE